MQCNSIHFCYFICVILCAATLDWCFWVFDCSFKDKKLYINKNEAKVLALNADEILGACKQQNWSCYDKKVNQWKELGVSISSAILYEK